MKLTLLIAGILATNGIAVVALAGPQPKPPLSGVVVHLFGQNALVPSILPANTAAASKISGSTPSTEPTLADIAHQMFVAGDPEHPPEPAPGKSQTYKTGLTPTN